MSKLKELCDALDEYRTNELPAYEAEALKYVSDLVYMLSYGDKAQELYDTLIVPVKDEYLQRIVDFNTKNGLS